MGLALRASSYLVAVITGIALLMLVVGLVLSARPELGAAEQERRERDPRGRPHERGEQVDRRDREAEQPDDHVDAGERQDSHAASGEATRARHGRPPVRLQGDLLHDPLEP